MNKILRFAMIDKVQAYLSSNLNLSKAKVVKMNFFLKTPFEYRKCCL